MMSETGKEPAMKRPSSSYTIQINVIKSACKSDLKGRNELHPSRELTYVLVSEHLSDKRKSNHKDGEAKYPTILRATPKP